MTHRSALVVGLAVGLVAMALPAGAETYYVMPGSTVDFDANYSFSVSGYLKLIIFPEDGWLDWLNPKANSYGGIYAYTTAPGSVTGTFDAEEAGGQLTISGMNLDLLSGQPQALTAGADLHADGIPSAVLDLLQTFLGQYLTFIDPNIIDPNIIWDVIGTITAGFDFHPALAASLTELTLTKVGDPVVAVLDPNGAFSNVWLAANVDSTIKFGDPNTILSDPNGFDVPPIPITFPITGQYTGDPVGAVTFEGSVEPEGSLTTPNIVLFDQVIGLPIGPNSITVNFHLHLQVDDGHAGIRFDPTITTISGYLLTSSWSPVERGSLQFNPPGPKYAPGSTVTVTAVGVPGWVFDHWEGDATGFDNPLTLTMDGHKTIHAVFTKEFYWVTLGVQGNGFISFSGDGVYDPATGKTKVRVEVPDTITLMPIPSSGWAFTNWTGDIPVGHETDNPLVLAPTGPMSVTAVFTKTGSCGTGLGLPLAAVLGCMGLMVALRRRA